MEFTDIIKDIDNWFEVIALTLILVFLILKQWLGNKSAKKDKAVQRTILSSISYKLDQLINQYKNHLTIGAAVTLIEHTLNYNKYNLLSYLKRIIYVNNIKENKEQITDKIELKIKNLFKEAKNKLHKFKVKDFELSEYIGDTYVNSQDIINFLIEQYDMYSDSKNYNKIVNENIEDFLNNTFDLLINEVVDRLD